MRRRWSALYQQVVWLHVRWEIYCQLGTSPECIKILNRAASSYFYIAQGAILSEIQLTLSKLAQKNKANLTVRSILEDSKQLKAGPNVKRLELLVAEYEQKCKEIIERRNKQIAHNDWETMLKSESAPLLGPSRKEIEDALGALRAFMNHIENHYTGLKTAYGCLSPGGDGTALILVLKRGLRDA